MKEFNKEIIKVLEDAGFNIGEITEQDGEYYVELSQYTPEGEDWYVIIWFDDTDEDFIKSVRTCADNFDVDEEAEPYIEMRGQRGVPNSIADLIEDAKWKGKTLEDLADALEALDSEDECYSDTDDDEEAEDYTITLKVVDSGKAIWVTSNEDPNGEEAEFKTITDRGEQMLIALATYLGYEPSMVLNLEGIEEEEELSKDLEIWKVFEIDGKEVCSYTLLGEGKGEEAATIDLLAAEHGISPDGIKVYIVERQEVSTLTLEVNTGLRINQSQRLILHYIEKHLKAGLWKNSKQMARYRNSLAFRTDHKEDNRCLVLLDYHRQCKQDLPEFFADLIKQIIEAEIKDGRGTKGLVWSNTCTKASTYFGKEITVQECYEFYELLKHYKNIEPSSAVESAPCKVLVAQSTSEEVRKAFDEIEKAEKAAERLFKRLFN